MSANRWSPQARLLLIVQVLLFVELSMGHSVHAQGVPHGVPYEELQETADEVLMLDREARWPRHLRSALDLPGWLDLGVAHRTRFMSYDRPFRVGEIGTNSQFEQQTRLRMGLNGRQLPFELPFRILFEFQDSRTNDDEPDDFATLSRSSVVNRFDISQLFISTTFHDLFGTGLRADLHLGRMGFDIGRRDLVGRQFFGNVPFNFDGVHLNLMEDQTWRIRLFLVRPVTHTPTTLDPQFFDQRLQVNDRLFWGVYHEAQMASWLTTNLYYYGLNDKPDLPQRQRTINTFGLRLLKDPKVGAVDFDVQTTWQVGTISPAGTINQQDLFAHYQHAEFGYTFTLPWRPRLTGVFDYFSGTQDPGKEAGFNGTFQPLFGPRHFDLMPTGIFGPFRRSNLYSPGWRLITEPTDTIIFQIWGRQWNLASSKDAFVGSGLQDPTGKADSSLGRTLDVRFWWNVGETNYWIEAGYLHWFKGDFFMDLRKQGQTTLPDKDTDLFYLSTTLRF